MLREDEADGADDKDLITLDVLLSLPLDVHHGARVRGPVRTML